MGKYLHNGGHQSSRCRAEHTSNDAPVFDNRRLGSSALAAAGCAPDVVLRDVAAQPVGEVQEAVVQRDEDVGDEGRHLGQQPALHSEPGLSDRHVRCPAPVAALRACDRPRPWPEGGQPQYSAAAWPCIWPTRPGSNLLLLSTRRSHAADLGRAGNAAPTVASPAGCSSEPETVEHACAW